MRIDRCIAAVYEKAQFAESAAVTDKLVNIRVCRRISRTLKGEISKMSVEGCLHRICQRFDSLEFFKAYRMGSTELLREIETHIVAVNRRDILDTERAEYRDTDQADRSASLYDYAAVKTQDSRCLCSFYRMYEYRTRLDQNSGIQIQIAYIKYRRTAADQNVIGKPSVQMHIVVWKQSIYIRRTYVLFIQVIHRDFRVIFKDHTGHDLVSDMKVFARTVFLYVLSHLDDLAGPFMSERYRDQTERVAFKFMRIRSADAAAFHLDQNVVIADLRHGKLFYFKFFQFCQHRYMGGRRDSRSRLALS